MTSFSPNDIFNFPAATLMDKRIPKTVVVKQGNLTKTEAKRLDKASELRCFANICNSTVHVPSVINDDYNIQSVLFLQCELKTTQNFSEIAEVLHRCFANPTCIVLDSADDICLSTAIRRNSLREKNATVVEEIVSTGKLCLSSEVKEEFLEACKFSNLCQDDLLCFCNSIARNFRLARIADSVGFFPKCEPWHEEEMMKLVNCYTKFYAEYSSIETLRKSKDTSLKDSTTLRVQSYDLKTQLDRIAVEIKALTV